MATTARGRVTISLVMIAFHPKWRDVLDFGCISGPARRLVDAWKSIPYTHNGGELCWIFPASSHFFAFRTNERTPIRRPGCGAPAFFP